MLASPKIRCKVIVIDAEDFGMPTRDTSPKLPATGPRFKTSDLAPMHDPYIAGLVRKLQDEVRAERQVNAQVCDLGFPWGEDDFEFDYEPVENEIDF